MRNRTISIVSAFLIVLVVVGCAIAVNAGASDSAVSSAVIYYVPDDYATIQGAVNNAAAGDTIIVRDGTYLESVKVNKRLTIRSENGPANTIVASPEGVNDHVLTVTADHVSINGLTVKNATGKNEAGQYNYAGLYISANHCDITDNKAMNNAYGLFLSDSTKNTLKNNIASDNIGDGIYLDHSDSNTISNNTVKLNHRYGIRLWHSHNNTVCNTNASNNQNGIRLDYSPNNRLEKNDAHSNNLNGFFLNSSNSNTLIKNDARSNNHNGLLLSSSNNNTLTNNGAKLNNGAGISLVSSSHSTLAHNTASANNEAGISLYTSSNCILTGNMMDGNYYNFGVSGNDINHVIHSIDASNLVDGKPVYYLVAQRNQEIPKDAGFVGVVLSSNITVKDLTLTNNSVGVMLAYSLNSSIANVRTSNNFNGIALYASINNTLINNTNTNNEWGIFLDSSDSNLLTLNTNLNNERGIFMESSNDNLLRLNTNLNNVWGIFLDSSKDNLLRLNTNLNNRRGIALDASSNNNILTGNNISNNNWTGISIGESHNNLIYLNNFINNSKNVYPVNSTTFWYSNSELTYTYIGANYTSYMGNYWDEYIKDTGSSVLKQDDNGNGIGESSHIVSRYVSLDRDNYPLMMPFEYYFI